MRIDEERFGEVTVLTVHGDFDARTAPLAHEKLDDLLMHFRARLVIDVSGLDIVTSTAISFLVDAAKRTRNMRGDTFLAQPPRLLVTSLRSLEIGDYFEIFNSNEEAVARYAEIAAQEKQHTEAETKKAETGKGPWWRFGRK